MVLYYNLHVVSKEKYILKYVIDVLVQSMSPNPQSTRKTKHKFGAKTLENPSRLNCLQIHTFLRPTYFMNEIRCQNMIGPTSK